MFSNSSIHSRVLLRRLSRKSRAGGGSSTKHTEPCSCSSDKFHCSILTQNPLLAPHCPRETCDLCTVRGTSHSSVPVQLASGPRIFTLLVQLSPLPCPLPGWSSPSVERGRTAEQERRAHTCWISSGWALPGALGKQEARNWNSEVLWDCTETCVNRRAGRDSKRGAGAEDGVRAIGGGAKGLRGTA
jgi:hypothetical protein